ncbi:MAG: STAS domain-containing protein [Selenomonadaceae bacterium]|nr:STAS domain-containing protein [Selenomonadaceae bacterium]
MKTSYKNGTLNITLPERINTTNAADFEKELFAIKELKDAEEILFNANNLQFISSMGLRVLFKLAKKFEDTPMTMINTSNEVREIFEETGVTSFIKVYKKIRRVDVTSLKLLGVGMYGSVYRVNEEQILKVFHNIRSEFEMRKVIDIVRTAFTHGIPTIMPFEVVKTDAGLGVVLELLNSTILSTLIHDNEKDFDKHVVEMVQLAKLLADTKFEEGALPARTEFLMNIVESAAEYLTPAEIAEIKKYVDVVPHRLSAVHGDFHARNIMIMDDQPLLIDMDEFSCGHPVWDIGGTHRIYQDFPHFSDDITYKLFELKDITLAQFYFKLIGFTVDEADRCWEKFFDEYFKDYSAQEKIYLAETAKVYGAFMTLIFSIERCHLTKNNPEKLPLKIDAVRFFLKEMQSVDFDHIKKAFEVWQ